MADIAFRTTTWALRDWIDLRRPDLRPEAGWSNDAASGS